MAVADVMTTNPGVAAVAGRRVGSGSSFFGSAAFLGWCCSMVIDEVSPVRTSSPTFSRYSSGLLYI